MSFEAASAWIASHSLGNPASFQRDALKLGDAAIPGMVEVLARGPMEQHTAAALVLSFRGIRVSSDGISPEDFAYQLLKLDGTRQVIHPLNLTSEDFVDSFTEPVPATSGVPEINRILLRYLVLFAIAGVLAFAASQTSGALRLALAIVAGLAFGVATWSTVFMAVMRLIVVKGEDITRRMEQSDGPPS
jgi:hypothetical protein